MQVAPTGATRIVGVPDDSWTDALERLRTYIAARVGDDETAADIAQDVIVRSIASGALATVDNPIAWLYRSAGNAVIDHYRTRRVHDRLDERPDRWPERSADDGEPSAATRELARCLQPLLQRLDPKYRDALTRVDLNGQTHQEAAGQLGISVSGMKSRVQRGRRQLRDLLTGCCTVHVDPTGALTDYDRTQADCGCASGPSPRH
jgi:RNA polymerase sigma-70 factor (ECF subfamily)